MRFLIIPLILTLTITGCGESAEEKAERESKERFDRSMKEFDKTMDKMGIGEKPVPVRIVE